MSLGSSMESIKELSESEESKNDLSINCEELD